MARYELFLTRLPEIEPQRVQATLALFPPQLNRNMMQRALRSGQVPKAAIAWGEEREPLFAIQQQIAALGGDGFVYEQSTWLQRGIDPLRRAIASRRAREGEHDAEDSSVPRIASFDAVQAGAKRLKLALLGLGVALVVVIAGLIVQRWTEMSSGFTTGVAGISKLRHSARSAQALREGSRKSASAPAPAAAPVASRAQPAEQRGAVARPDRTPPAAPASSNAWTAARAVARGLGSELVEARWIFVALALGMLVARLFAWALRGVFAEGATRWWARSASVASAASLCAALALLDLPEASTPRAASAPAVARALAVQPAPARATAKPFAGLIAELRQRHARRLTQSNAGAATAAARMQTSASAGEPTDDAVAQAGARLGATASARIAGAHATHGRERTRSAQETEHALTRSPTEATDAEKALGSTATGTRASRAARTEHAPSPSPTRDDAAAMLLALVREVASKAAGPALTPAEDCIEGMYRAPPADADAFATVAPVVAVAQSPRATPQPRARARAAGHIGARVEQGIRWLGLSTLIGVGAVTLLILRRRHADRRRPSAPIDDVHCPRCGARYPTGTAFCGEDGQPLHPPS